MITSPPTEWDLWVLRALDPDAGPADVIAQRDARRRHEKQELEACRRLLAGDLRSVLPGRRLLAQRPELTGGLILTLHLGPYQLVLEPFLAAGLELTVVLNQAAELDAYKTAASLSDAERALLRGD